MTYQVILDTVWAVVYEGSKSDCEIVMKAFTQYNNAHNIILIEKEAPALTEHTRNINRIDI